MSTNIHFIATREIQVVKTGNIESQQIGFIEWQTPTEVTKQIMASSDPIQAYKDWVIEITEDEEELVYADDDVFCDGPSIGTKIFNAGEEHVAVFDQWLKECEQAGYTVEAEAW